MEKILKELCECFGPPGFEEEVKKKIEDFLRNKNFEKIEDRFGNLIYHLKGEKPSLAFTAHIDEIGIVCTDADERGFLSCAPLGGVYPHLYTGHRVVFKNGIIGIFTGKDWKDSQTKDFSEIKIDIGTKKKEEALEKVPIGEPGVIYSSFVFQENKIISRNLDNRAGVSVLLDIMLENNNFERDIYFVFNTQEEIGLRGARVFSEYLEVEFVFTIDVSTSGDTYAEPKRAFEIGKGAGIRVMDRGTVFPQKLINYLENLAKENNIKVQRDAGSTGMTDAFYIQTARGGIPSIAITIPIRYTHSPSSFVLMDDLYEVKKLIKAVIKNPPK